MLKGVGRNRERVQRAPGLPLRELEGEQVVEELTTGGRLTRAATLGA